MSVDNIKVANDRTLKTIPLIDVKSLGPPQLKGWIAAMGQPHWRANQIIRWLYTRGGIESFDEMTNLPLSFRKQLKAIATIGTLTLTQIQTARDQTVKALLRLPSGRAVETVLIPDFDAQGEAKRLTVCVSSQVGCAMGCTFCATGKMGFLENLTCGQIADQVLFMNTIARKRYKRNITNVVFMGMGEPLLNFTHVVSSLQILTSPDGLEISQKRITVSTVGIARRIRDLAHVEPK